MEAAFASQGLQGTVNPPGTTQRVDATNGFAKSSELVPLSGG